MGLDVYTCRFAAGTDPNDSDDPIAEYEYPEEIGYFRSSYNDSGFNSVMRAANLSGLYEIFGVENDRQHYIRPDWTATRARAVEALAAYDTCERAKYRVMRFPVVAPSDDVLGAFLSGSSSFGWYSSRDGVFFRENPPRVRAVGVAKGFVGNDIVVVLDREPSADNKDWYREMIVRVVSLCDAVAESGAADRTWLGWSS